jgi:hypothetical protein
MFPAQTSPTNSGLSVRIVSSRSKAKELSLVLVFMTAYQVQASCHGDFLREQVRGFHDLLRQKPTSLFILLG